MACVAVYLTNADKCNPNIRICSGRHNSQAEAEAECAGGSGSGGSGSGGGGCCGPGVGASTVAATVLSSNPDSSSDLVPMTLTRAGTSNLWSGSATAPDGSLVQLWASCSGDQWSCNVQRGGDFPSYATGVALVGASNPMTGTGHFVGGPWATQFFSITVTHPCPE